MKKKFTRTGLLMPILLCCILVHGQQVAKYYNYSGFGLVGFYEFRPAQYGNQHHPLIIFLHGAGQVAKDTSHLSKVLEDGLPKIIAAGASMKFGNDAFVVLSPQTGSNWDPIQGGEYWKIKAMLKYAKDSLQIDTNRIYITGLSLGGGGVWDVITYDTNDIKLFAAAAPIAAIRPNPDSGYCRIAKFHIPVWAFHNDGDGGLTSAYNTKDIIGHINACTPGPSPLPRVTYYASSVHDAWDSAYDTVHRAKALSTSSDFVSNANQDTINVFEWFLQHTRQTTIPPSNQPPVAVAGADTTITLPADSIILNGSASHDNDGTITSYAWIKVSGGSATIVHPGNATTIVTGLTQGVYQFLLTVTDNNGATGSDTVQVTVNPAASSPYYGMDSLLLMGRYALVKRPTEDPSYTVTKKYPLIIEIPGQFEYGDEASPGVTALFNSGTPKLLKNGVNIYPNDKTGHPIYYIAIKYQPNAYGDLTIPDGFSQLWDTIMAQYPVDTAKDAHGKYKYVMLVGVAKGGATVFNFTNWNSSMTYGGNGSYRALNLKNIVTSASYDLQGDTALLTPAAWARLNNKRLRFFEMSPPQNDAQGIYNSIAAYSNASEIQFQLTGLTSSQVVDSLYSPYGTNDSINIYKMLVDDTTTFGLASMPQSKTGLTQPLTGTIDAGATSIIVYPNPVRDLVHIAAGAGTRSIGLYSTEGKKLALSAAPVQQGSEVVLNISSLARGIYFLHVKGMDGTIRITKVVKL